MNKDGRAGRTSINPNGRWFTNEGREEAKASFLEAYTEVGTVITSCASIGIHRDTFYEWLKTDPDFATKFDDVRNLYDDKIRNEIHRRALVGVEKIKRVFYRGALIGEYPEHQVSDRLLMFLARSRMPEFRGIVEQPSRDGLAEGETPAVFPERQIH